MSSLQHEDQIMRLLSSTESILDQCRSERRLLTYLELADALAMAPPHRIGKTAHLLELLMDRDAELGGPLRSSLVISQTRSRLPAPGFFLHARQLGLFDGTDAGHFHAGQLALLFR